MYLSGCNFYQLPPQPFICVGVIFSMDGEYHNPLDLKTVKIFAGLQDSKLLTCDPL